MRARSATTRWLAATALLLGGAPIAASLVGSVVGSVVASAVAPIVATPLAAQTVRVLQRQAPRADTLIDQVFSADVNAVRRMVEAWREREELLLRELRAVSDGDLLGRRRADEQLTLHTRQGFALMSAIQARCMDEQQPRPAGYLGVNLTSEFTVVDQKPKSLGTRITSVEPGSPAERAGVLRDDRVLSIGGLDTRERVPEISGQLVPGRTVVIRVERDGAARDLAVVVGRRPEGFGESCGEFERALMPMRFAGPGRMMLEGRGGEIRRVFVGSPTEEGRMPEREELRIMVFGTGAESRFFAGAEFRPLDADWGEVLGVKQGVIVSEVAHGSAAAMAGLKNGDVVTAVGRAPVASPLMLVQLLGTQERPEASLSVMRGKERRTITLKWEPR